LLHFEVQLLIKRWLHVIVINEHGVVLVKCNNHKIFNEMVDISRLLAYLCGTWGASVDKDMDHLSRTVIKVSLEFIFRFRIYAKPCIIMLRFLEFSVVKRVFIFTSHF